MSTQSTAPTQSADLLPFLFSGKGRITRGEWWALQFFALLLTIVVMYFRGPTDGGVKPSLTIILCLLVVNIAAIWIFMAATAKRFHDRGKSGWNCLWQFLPILGTFYVLYQCGITDNGVVTNVYGAPRVKLPSAS